MVLVEIYGPIFPISLLGQLYAPGLVNERRRKIKSSVKNQISTGEFGNRKVLEERRGF